VLKVALIWDPSPPCCRDDANRDESSDQSALDSRRTTLILRETCAARGMSMAIGFPVGSLRAGKGAPFMPAPLRTMTVCIGDVDGLA
jgi:hypothetical protein